MRRRVLASFLLLLAAACEEGVQVDSTNARIVGGTVDSADPAVAAILIETTAGDVVGICTGTLISKRVILTAAHCVKIVDPNLGVLKPGAVFFGTNVDGQGTTIRVVKSTYHPSFDEERLEDGNDVAMLLLESPAPATPIDILRSRMDAHVGASVRLVGFGITGGGLRDDGTKRQVSTQIDEVDPLLMWVYSATRNTCNGDSGGPTFLSIGGREVVAGITSFGDKMCVQAGASTRVDVYATTFIDPWVKANDPTATSTNSCGSDGMCVETCTAPPDPDCAEPTDPDPPGVVPDDDSSLEPLDVQGGCAVGHSPTGALAMWPSLLALIFLSRHRRRA